MQEVLFCDRTFTDLRYEKSAELSCFLLLSSRRDKYSHANRRNSRTEDFHCNGEGQERLKRNND